MKVKCEKCKKRYELEKPKERNITDEIIEVYFICPLCDHEVHSFYKNKKAMRLMNKNGEYQKELKNTEDDNRRNLLLGKIRGNKFLIEKEQEVIEEQLNG